LVSNFQYFYEKMKHKIPGFEWNPVLRIFHCIFVDLCTKNINSDGRNHISWPIFHNFLDVLFFSINFMGDKQAIFSRNVKLKLGTESYKNLCQWNVWCRSDIKALDIFSISKWKIRTSVLHLHFFNKDLFNSDMYKTKSLKGLHEDLTDRKRSGRNLSFRLHLSILSRLEAIHFILVTDFNPLQ